MESWFYSCWIHIWPVIVLFRNVAGEPASSPRYTIHLSHLSFDLAMEKCSPGVLTTLTTDTELTNILEQLFKYLPLLNQNELIFWVGLKRVKTECVVPTLPLRGFKWMEDRSEETQVIQWTEEPKHTCTSVRCAALKLELDGLTVKRWGLIPVTCKSSHQFICKLKASLIGGPLQPRKPIPLKPEAATTKDVTQEPYTPATLQPPKSAHMPLAPKPETATPETELHTREAEANTELIPKTEPELQRPDPNSGSEQDIGSESCPLPILPGAGTPSPDPHNSSRLKVECLSDVQLELRCSGRPAMWRLLDDTPANFSTICQLCEDGFQKNTYGNCVDINECNSGPFSCWLTCLNTEGSYRCVCYDENGKDHDEDSLVCKESPKDDDSNLLSSILFPVLVAVAALVVLVVVVAVIVKCCLMRRSKTRAIKKAKKMAMKSKDDKDSFEPANETAAV